MRSTRENQIKIKKIKQIDLIIGKDHKGALLTIMERKSSYVIIEPLKTKSAKEVKQAIYNDLIPYKQWINYNIRQWKRPESLLEQAKQFAFHQQIAKKLEISYYFAHPYSSWERGLNEYTNKLIRQYFPKKNGVIQHSKYRYIADNE